MSTDRLYQTAKWPVASVCQTFVIRAANFRFEPNPEETNSCCVRTQRGNLLRRREIAAALQREMRPFRQIAANLKRQIHITRDGIGTRHWRPNSNCLYIAFAVNIAKLFAGFKLAMAKLMKIPTNVQHLRGFRYPREIVASAVCG